MLPVRSPASINLKLITKLSSSKNDYKSDTRGTIWSEVKAKLVTKSCLRNKVTKL